jgi:endonuclease YncB( thermonuclease family)
MNPTTRPCTRLVLGLVGCAPTPASGGPGEAPAESGVVSRVVDGDTIDVDLVGRIRLVGIDTPERDACGCDQATAAMTALGGGRAVQLVRPAGVDDTDPCGRLLRYVDLPDGTDVGLARLRAGWPAPPTTRPTAYPPHSREPDYRAADDQTADLGCYPP